MKRTLSMAILCLSILPLAGCTTIYTTRVQGPQQSGITVFQDGASVNSVHSEFGPPDETVALSGGSELHIYHSNSYMNILGLYATSRETDLVVTFVDGKMQSREWTNRAKTMAIGAGQTFALGVNVED